MKDEEYIVVVLKEIEIYEFQVYVINEFLHTSTCGVIHAITLFFFTCKSTEIIQVTIAGIC